MKGGKGEGVLVDWAGIQCNLGIALLRLGELESDPARLDEAVAAFKMAIEIFQAADASHYLGAAKANLRRAEAVLHRRR